MANPRGSKTKVGQDKSELVASIPRACSDEQVAVEFMEAQRWGETPACPRCGDTDVVQMKSKTGERNKRFLWRCHGCKQQFTVRVGTIMEDSPIPLRHWCYAFWKACSSKKGVSALQIKRETGLSYKSALFMMHRIRYAMTSDHSPQPKLQGTVEVDETYVGGKPRPRTRRRKMWEGYKYPKPRMAHLYDRKVPVVALVERGGQARAMVVERVTAQTLAQAIACNMNPTARMMTDDAAPYKGIGRKLASEHHTVRHTCGEYVSGDAHTNTVEGFFSLLKRGVYGTFHSVSRKHLHRYVGEFEFRYNYRWMEDGERTVAAIQGSDGKRLPYSRYVGRTRKEQGRGK
jgi:transposase-like protein